MLKTNTPTEYPKWDMTFTPISRYNNVVNSRVRKELENTAVLILLSGLYMAATLVGWMGWIVVALASLVLIAILGATLTGLRSCVS